MSTSRVPNSFEEKFVRIIANPFEIFCLILQSLAQVSAMESIIERLNRDLQRAEEKYAKLEEVCIPRHQKCLNSSKNSITE